MKFTHTHFGTDCQQPDSISRPGRNTGVSVVLSFTNDVDIYMYMGDISLAVMQNLLQGIFHWGEKYESIL